MKDGWSATGRALSVAWHLEKDHICIYVRTHIIELPNSNQSGFLLWILNMFYQNVYNGFGFETVLRS